MKELDLHGLFHHQVKDKVENFILLNARNLPEFGIDNLQL